MSLKAVANTPNAANAIGPGGASGVTPLVLATSGIPFINISSGSMGNNGALTGVTALPATYSNGAYIWLPAGAIAAGVPAAAAWYWCVFSSTTAGTVYNSTYTSGQPTAGTTTAFATTGPGAFSGDTGEVGGPTITIPGNSLGTQGQIYADYEYAYNNTAGTKTPRIRYSALGGSQYYGSNQTTSVGLRGQTIISNRGVTNSQVGSGYGIVDGGTISAGKTTSSVDTTAASTLVFSLQKGTATDYIILDKFCCSIIYRA